MFVVILIMIFIVKAFLDFLGKIHIKKQNYLIRHVDTNCLLFISMIYCNKSIIERFLLMSIYTDGQLFHYVAEFNRRIPIPDLTGVDDYDCDVGLNYFQIRTVLACRGWVTSLHITAPSMGGELRLHFSAKHLNWHGTLAEVNVYSVGECAPDAEILEQKINHMAKTVYEWAQKAMFQDQFVPFVMSDGSFVVNQRETDYYKTFPTANVKMPERACPTEALPGWPGYISIVDWLNRSVDSGNYLFNICQALRGALTNQKGVYSDSLDSYHNAFNYEQRRWAWKTRWHYRPLNRLKGEEQQRMVDDFSKQCETNDLLPSSINDLTQITLRDRDRFGFMLKPKTEG